MECLLPYLCMVTVPHIMVGLERMLDYRGVGLVRFHCSGLAIGIDYFNPIESYLHFDAPLMMLYKVKTTTSYNQPTAGGVTVASHPEPELLSKTPTIRSVLN